eukprot:g65516.t1
MLVLETAALSELSIKSWYCSDGFQHACPVQQTICPRGGVVTSRPPVKVLRHLHSDKDQHMVPLRAWRVRRPRWNASAAEKAADYRLQASLPMTSQERNDESLDGWGGGVWDGLLMNASSTIGSNFGYWHSVHLLAILS